jgi:hypothetical protein
MGEKRMTPLRYALKELFSRPLLYSMTKLEV